MQKQVVNFCVFHGDCQCVKSGSKFRTLSIGTDGGWSSGAVQVANKFTRELTVENRQFLANGKSVEFVVCDSGYQQCRDQRNDLARLMRALPPLVAIVPKVICRHLRHLIKRLTTETQDTMDFLAILRPDPAVIPPDPSEMLELNNSAVLFYYEPNAGFSTAGNQFAPPFRRSSHSPIRSGPHEI